MTNNLYIKLNREPVGYIKHNPSDDTFAIELYDKELQLSPHITSGSDSGPVKRFIMNLLPEGQGLEELSSMMHLSKSNVFGLIKAIGTETTGALSFHTTQDEIEETSFREIPEGELISRIKERSQTPITIWDNKPRLSVAGVQEKLPVMINVKGTYGIGEGNLASTQILKFGKNPDEHIVLNEHLCMTLAKRLNLPVAETEILRLGEPVLKVKRFDRIYRDTKVDRLHIIDGCQMLDLPPSYKYERVYGDGRDVKDFREGASLEKLFKAAALCSVPAAATRDILNWVLFNLIIGNCDAHGKNISWHYTRDEIRVTPFYDMLSISIYGGKYNQNLAMAVGDNFSAKVYAYDLAEMCEVCGLQPRFVARTLDKMAKAVWAETYTITSGLDLSGDESDFAAELISLLKANAKWHIEVAKDLPHVK
jgi:serine/threonine-protein kinase HipA